MWVTAGKEVALPFISRIINAPNHSGRWGEMLSCAGAFWLALGLLFPEWAPDESPSLSVMIATLGRAPCTAWLFVAAVLPIVCIGIGTRLAGIVGTTLGMFTWLLLASIVAWRSGILAPGVGVYLVFFLACCMAEFRLLRHIEVEKWTGTTSEQ